LKKYGIPDYLNGDYKAPKDQELLWFLKGSDDQAKKICIVYNRVGNIIVITVKHGNDNIVIAEFPHNRLYHYNMVDKPRLVGAKYPHIEDIKYNVELIE